MVNSVSFEVAVFFDFGSCFSSEDCGVFQIRLQGRREHSVCATFANADKVPS